MLKTENSYYFGVISDLLNVDIKKFQSSYYSVTYGLTALKIHQDTVHQKVGEQHIGQKSSIFNNFLSYECLAQWSNVKLSVAITQLAMVLHLGNLTMI